MKKVTLLLLLLGLQASVFAQGFGIFNNSNYAPVQSVYFNPAKIADSKQKFQFNLIGFNLYVANDYGVLQSIPKLIKTVQNNGEFGDILTLQQNGKAKNLDLGVEFRGPSFVASLGHSQSLAFSSRARFLSSANNCNGNNSCCKPRFKYKKLEIKHKTDSSKNSSERSACKKCVHISRLLA